MTCCRGPSPPPHATETGGQLLSCVMESPLKASSQPLDDMTVTLFVMGERRDSVAFIPLRIPGTRGARCRFRVGGIQGSPSVRRRSSSRGSGAEGDDDGGAEGRFARGWIPFVRECRRRGNPPHVLSYSWNFLCLYNREVLATFPAEGVSVLPHGGRRGEGDPRSFLRVSCFAQLRRHT